MPRPEDDFADSDPAGRDHPTRPSICLDPTTGFSSDSPGLDPEEFTAPEGAIPLTSGETQTEYQKLAEHLSKLGLERDHFANQMGVKQYHEDEPMRLLLRGQAQIMGALALFARDYDPKLYVHAETSSDTMFGGVRVEPGSVLDAVTRGMDRMGLEALGLPSPTEGHRWALWRGGERDATGEVAGPPGLPVEPRDRDPLRPGPAPVKIRLRDGRTHRVALGNLEWAHDGSGRDILAFEEPIPGD